VKIEDSGCHGSCKGACASNLKRCRLRRKRRNNVVSECCAIVAALKLRCRKTVSRLHHGVSEGRTPDESGRFYIYLVYPAVHRFTHGDC
jgi:hypothetical protein